ncbi:MAG: bifunctional diguanylate cyclase/phosphodiesterase, partial [Propionibacteriales bacterium]|nr:bifunctional diguanylate cyclase/phosphodiesterase [Propionibacteriales bacterium]
RLTSPPSGPSAAEPDRIRKVLLLVPYPFVLSAVVTAAWMMTVGPGLDDALITIGILEVVTLVARQVVTLVESEHRADALVYQATHDQLTGLCNRTRFRDHLDAALQRKRGATTVLFVDVDDFKDLNDSFGHSVGDDVLRRLSLRLRNCLKGHDTVARLGGDEFGVVLEGVDLRQVMEIAGRVVDALGRPMVIQHEHRSLSVSIGVAVSDPGSDTAELLLRNADLAMYEAKRTGRNRCALYAPPMHSSVLAWTELVRQLERAVERAEFSVVYQPMFDLRSRNLVGAEALLRWQHPDRGTLTPAAFLAAAEQSGFIVDIEAWLLERACKFVGGLMSEQLVAPTFQLSVNVAPRTLRDPGFVDRSARRIAESPMRAYQLLAEITESVFIDTAESLPTLCDLRDLGVRIALDDFGTGYSSLSYLDRLPVDVLKIDKSFIDDVDHNPDRLAIVKAVVDMATTLRLTTVAEGIERESQLTALDALGCQRGQGFHLCRPLDEAAFITYLSQSSTPQRVTR